jgi:hypothetical protein
MILSQFINRGRIENELITAMHREHFQSCLFISHPRRSSSLDQKQRLEAFSCCRIIGGEQLNSSSPCPALLSRRPSESAAARHRLFESSKGSPSRHQTAWSVQVERLKLMMLVVMLMTEVFCRLVASCWLGCSLPLLPPVLIAPETKMLCTS